MIAYLDCFSGISGDMLLGALLDAGLSLDDLRADLARLPLSGYEVTAEKVTRQGLAATRAVVSVGPAQVNRGLHDILSIIDRASLPQQVAQPASRALRRPASSDPGGSATEVSCGRR